MGTNIAGIGNANAIGFKSRVTGGAYLPPELKDALVGVWSAYDKSNNSTDRNIIKNKIKDRGGDFVISNAAFKLNSGYGKYEEDFTSWNSSSYVSNIRHDSFDVNKDGTSVFILYKNIDSSSSDTPSFKIKVSNLINSIIYAYINDSGVRSFFNIKENGEYILPKSYNSLTPTTTWIGFRQEPDVNCECTITQIPSYQGAFVTDGIDDLITSTKTVQEMLGGSNEITVVSMIHGIGSKNAYTNVLRESGSNYIKNTSTADGKTGIYGYTSKDTTKSIITDILGDKNDYKLEHIQTSTPSTINSVFSVAGWRDSSFSMVVYPIAWYWTIIANKVLTTDQINQVIAYFNLDRTLKPDILCDVKKQGITNENHAEFGDKLIDFSGNGRDIQLNNLAWKLDSGIGKYETDLSDTRIWTRSKEITSSPFSFSYNGLSGWILFANTELTNSTDIPSFKIQIKGLLEGQELIYRYYDSNGQSNVYSMGKDGEYTLPSDVRTAKPQTSNTSGFQVVKNEANIITITQIPSHAGSLCLDGVNDFGKVTGMPVYKDYTIVVDYERISGIEQAWAEALISKAYIANQGAFVLMETNGMAKHSYSFGAYTTFNKDDSTRTLLYQSKYKCGDVDLNAGTGIDGDILWLGTYRDNYSSFFNGAIYFLMSFPYSMSEFLIERQLKKHKLGTLYPDMVEFRPVIKSNASYDNIVFYYKNEKVENGTYLTVSSSIGMHICLSSNSVNEIKSITINGIPATFKFHDANNNIYQYDFNLTSKSPQKINITIDEYIRYEDIVQPYPSLFTLIDYDTEEVYSWGSKLKVGARFKGNVVNLLPNMYEWQGNVLYNGEVLDWGIKPGVVAKEMVFSWNMPFKYLIDNNEPKCILSPRLLRIPNSSYKILGYIPDISGHGNNGVIHNSAYAEGSGVNEDGSYQLDGVDDFVTIPTTVGGKQVLMKVNWNSSIERGILYDQRGYPNEFAIYNHDVDSSNNHVFAYQARNNGQTYIDGILNNNINASELRNITHNITITNELSAGVNTSSPVIGSNRLHNDFFANMALYDFMFFDEISTDDKIKELNEYVGIEAKVELPPYYWDAYGKTNLDADKATIQQRGVAVGDYDLTNYNHAYNKMSGYGGYKFAKFDNTIEWFAEDSSMVVNRNGYLITLKKVPNVAFWRFRNTTLKSLDNPLTFKVKCNKPIDVIFQVKFAKNNDVSIGYNYNIKEVTLVPNESTTIIVPSVSVSDIPEATSILFINVLFDNTSLSDNEEYTVEMLPLYPNGLLYDAVTDYSENVNIPVFTDFTAIMKRKWLKNQGCPLIKGSKVYEGGNGNALLFEWDKAYNFVFYKRTDIMEGEVPDNISFITPTNYNGNVITRGSEQDTNGICIAGDGNAGFANMVFYKLILYPKTIPLLQINFLKNLMEKDEIIDLNNPIFIKNE
jgi:hypothetical protein|nr:MAG TPA: hypothetical protein [Crassvirales sp.]